VTAHENGSDVVLVHEDGPLTELLRGIIARGQGKTVKFIKKRKDGEKA
jgi:hypothetical protein